MAVSGQRYALATLPPVSIGYEAEFQRYLRLGTIPTVMAIML
jgi:hypothetical protein